MAHSNRAGPAGICRQFCAKASELIGPNIRTANAIIRNIIDLLKCKKHRGYPIATARRGQEGASPWSFRVSVPMIAICGLPRSKSGRTSAPRHHSRGRRGVAQDPRASHCRASGQRPERRDDRNGNRLAHPAERDLDRATVGMRRRVASDRARHPAIQARRWPESNCRLLVVRPALELLPAVGVDSLVRRDARSLWCARTGPAAQYSASTSRVTYRNQRTSRPSRAATTGSSPSHAPPPESGNRFANTGARKVARLWK